MKAQDFRYGNIVEFIGIGVKPIWGIRIDGVFNVSSEFRTYDKIKPIKLTHSWLLSFGFEIEDGFYHKDGVWITPEYGIDGLDPFKPIKYVHQLQNLFFMITECELQRLI